MKRLFSSAFLLCIFAASLQADGAFEGHVRFQVTDPKGRSYNLDYSLKGNKTRVDMASSVGNLAVIVDEDSGISRIIFDQRRQYGERSLQNRIPKANSKISFEASGNSRAFLGYPCQEFIATSPRGKTEIWATTGLGTYRSFESGPMSRALAPAWEERLSSQGLFPLKIIEPNLTLTAVSVDKKSLPDSLFGVPAGYIQTDPDALNQTDRR